MFRSKTCLIETFSVLGRGPRYSLDNPIPLIY